jgi:hypothetical protein
MSPLATLFIILAGLALLGVAASLVLGVGAMTRGKEGDSRKSNKMMQLRIVCQALCLVFLFMAFAVS